MTNKYFIHKDQHCRFFFEKDGIIEEVYQLPGTWIGEFTIIILEWVVSKGWTWQLYIPPVPLTAEEKENFRKENCLENKNIIEKKAKEDAPTENMAWCRDHNQ